MTYSYKFLQKTNLWYNKNMGKNKHTVKKIERIIGTKKKFTKNLKDRHKYITKEYQDYGYRLAVKLDDLKHKALYIKLAKETERSMLEQAFSFAVDYPKAKNKGKIFMWKLKKLKEEK